MTAITQNKSIKIHHAKQVSESAISLKIRTKLLALYGHKHHNNIKAGPNGGICLNQQRGKFLNDLVCYLMAIGDGEMPPGIVAIVFP